MLNYTYSQVILISRGFANLYDTGDSKTNRNDYIENASSSQLKSAGFSVEQF
jgi:predicted enzyme involved in methoxymalonyl-ACP biosynthesis